MLEDFRNANLPDLGRDMSNIMSLNTAYTILLTCEKKRGCNYDDLPPRLKDAVDIGLDSGIVEIKKLKDLIIKALDGTLTNKERIYAHNLLIVFSYLRRRKLIAEAILKKDLTETEIQSIKDSIKRLDELSNSLKDLKTKKRIKGTELIKLRLNETLDSVQDNLFNKWLFIVNTLEKQQEH